MDIVDTIWHRPILVWYYFDISLKCVFKKLQTNLHCWCNSIIYSTQLLQNEKNHAIKVIMFNKERGNVAEFLIWRCVLLFGIVLKRYHDDSFLIICTKIIILYQRLDFKVSKPSFSYILLVEHPLMAPVMTSAVLHWSDSSLAWKVSLNPLSYITPNLNAANKWLINCKKCRWWKTVCE